MDAFARSDLRRFLEKPGGPCVTILMPTFRSGAETQQNPIRFRNLLQDAEAQLVSAGERPSEARDLLRPAADLLGNADFWRSQADGLGVFVSRGTFGAYRLALTLPERVVLHDRFHIKPLLPLFSNEGRFYLLALSQNEVRLFEGTKLTISRVDLEDAGVPKSLADALRYDEFERQLQIHTGGAGRGGEGTAMYSANDSIKDAAKGDLLRYFQQIDHGLHDLLRDQRIPLVLAGVEYLLPIYKEASTYAYLMEQGVPGNPELENLKRLHAQAWAVVEPHFRREPQKVLDRYRQLAGTGMASAEAGVVIPAAIQGRVDSLALAIGAEIRGAYHGETHSIELGEGVAGAEDLADLASAHTLINGGEVYALPQEQMPAGVSLAAVFRY